MKRPDNSQSGQSLVEYGLLIATVVLVAITTLMIPSALIYLYLRRTRHIDRKTAFMMAVGFYLVLSAIANLINALNKRAGDQPGKCCEGYVPCKCGKDCECEDCACRGCSGDSDAAKRSSPETARTED